jgi:hypothetical protein
MKKSLLLLALSFIIFSCLIILPNNTPEATDEDMKADPNSARDAAYLSKAEKEVVYFLNLARRDPKGFAEKYIAPERFIPEGEECYKEMLKIAPVSILKPSQTLSLAAQDHAKDMGESGREGHTATANGCIRPGKTALTVMTRRKA